MERLLLIMPRFMGYESYIKETLEERFQVTYINSDEYDEEILKNFYKSFIKKCLRKIKREVKNKDLEEVEQEDYDEMANNIISDKNAYRYVLCINGHFVPNRLYEYIKNNNPQAKFTLYTWDDVKNLIKSTHFQYFDNRYSYNINDCNKYRMKYLPMFVQGETVQHLDNCFDIAFIGTAHSDRIDIAKQLLDKYGLSKRVFIYLYSPQQNEYSFCHTTALSYKDYIEVLRKTDILFDSPSSLQEGPTTRAFDVLLTKTKLATTNKNIMDYPVFSDNMCIVDKNDIHIPESFWKQEYIENDYHALSIEEWLEIIGL